MHSDLRDFIQTMGIIVGLGLALILAGKGIAWLDWTSQQNRASCIEQTHNEMYCFEKY